MADLVATFSVAPVFLGITDIRSALAGDGGLAPGTAVYVDPAAGVALPTAANAAGKFAFRGLTTSKGGKGQAVSVVEYGYVAGFDLSAVPFDAPIYLSDTPGKLSTTPGTNSVVVGRVAALTDVDPSTGGPSKLLFVRPS